MIETTTSDSMLSINTTYFFNDTKSPTIVKKEFSTFVIRDTIRESIRSQYQYIFGVKPNEANLQILVDGFVLFNLHKNKNMLNSKNNLLNYIKNKSIPFEEKEYFLQIFLYNQRPLFLTFDEHEYIRACGDLDGFENIEMSIEL